MQPVFEFNTDIQKKREELGKVEFHFQQVFSASQPASLSLISQFDFPQFTDFCIT